MSGSAQLFVDLTVNQSNASSTLKGVAIVRQSASSTLKGKLIVRQSGYTKYFQNIFTVRQADATSLKGITIIRQSASSTLKVVLIVRNASSATLKGITNIKHSASKALFAKFRPAVLFSGKPRAIYSRFFRGVDASGDLRAVFNVTEEIGLKAEAVIRHSGTGTIHGEFKVKVFFVEGWATFKAEFLPRYSSSVSLLVKTVIRNKGSADLLEALIVRNKDSAELLAMGIIRHSASRDLSAQLIVRQPGFRDLMAKVMPRRSASKALFAVFEPIPNEDLKAESIIRHSTTKMLHADFYIRFPYRFWTNRRYLNGVVSAAETLIGDAVLEFIIEGVMDDIKTWLLANQIQTYTAWTTIENVPITIRRACTYGVVASLYARYTKTFTSRVIPSVAPVTVTVKADEREAMEHWEEKYEQMLDRYLAYTQTGRLFSTTSDEEPVFTMADMPPGAGTTLQEWHKWYNQVEG